MTTVVEAIATAYIAHGNCEKSNLPHHKEWKVMHAERIDSITKNQLPSGSGFDAGTTFDWVASRPERLVFHTSYHHMDEHGGYAGWTEHEVIVTPSLVGGFDLKVTGRNRNDIKDYIAETFYDALRAEEVPNK